MNNELLNKLIEIKDGLKKKDQMLRKEFELATSREEKLAIKELDDECATKFYEVKADIKTYRSIVESGESADKVRAYENMLADKYGIKLEREVEVVNVSKPKNKATKAIATVLAAALLVTGGAVLGKYINCPFRNRKEETTVVSSTSVNPTTTTEKPEIVVEKPFETYGMFTDVKNEEQLRVRAQWYYDTYIADSNKSNAGANFFTVEQIMNDMRMMNGEFMVNASGNPTYNDTDVIAVVNDLHTIANYDSFKQYGTQIYFTPMAPLFVDGSLAQKGAVDLDKAMAKVVAAIRANDDEAFLVAAREWGILVVNMFDYIDFTGDYVNVHQVATPQSFNLYHAMSSKYASTILEYSEAHHLNVCIPYCTDYNTGELHEEALSQIMYNLNERAIDAVAVRSGNQPEYEQNNISLPQDLCLLAKDYFNSKYELEIGSSRTLK